MPIRPYLDVAVYGHATDLVTSGLQVPQPVDAQGQNVDFRLDGRSLATPWDFDATTDRVELVESGGDSVTLARVGDYFRWAIQPGDLNGAGTAPGSTVNKTCRIVVTRTTGLDTVSNAPVRIASSRAFTLTLDRAALFSPDHIPGLEFWFDAYSVTEAVAATVQTWDEQSPQDRDLAQSTAGSRPTRQTDGTGRPYLLFDGTDDAMATVWNQLGVQATVFVAARILTYDGTVRAILQCGGTNGLRIAFDNANLKGISGSDTANTSLPALNTPFVATGTKAAAGAVTIRRNLVTEVSQASTAAVTAGALQVGDSTPDGFANVGVHEVVGYSSVLSAENQARVVRYLMQKWGAS